MDNKHIPAIDKALPFGKHFGGGSKKLIGKNYTKKFSPITFNLGIIDS